MEKNFEKWMKTKEYIHFNAPRRSFSEGEIWWIATGENVGVEINGKGEKYSRPVIIYKKLGKSSFVGIPLTSQPHIGTWYIQFEFKEREQYAVLPQVRMFSVARLYSRMGKMSNSDFKKVKNGFRELFF